MKVAIIGAGSAGMFAAYELMNKKGIEVNLFEAGDPISVRNRKDVMKGFGGAGAFSDGKLTLTTEYGGWLSDYFAENKLDELIERADKIWVDVSGVTEVSSCFNYEKIKDLEYLCSRHSLRLHAAKIRHLGTDNCLKSIINIYNEFEKSENIKVYCNTPITDLVIEKNCVKGLITESGEKKIYDKVIVAVGRSGNEWMQDLAKKYNIQSDINPVDIGIRVEVPNSVAEAFTKELYEFKIKYNTVEFEDEVRTFCVNPGGFIAAEKNSNNLITVNGHSYKNRKSGNTNFALLVSTKFTEPFKEPVKYGQNIAYLANMLSGGSILIQRFGDLLRGRRSTESRIRKNFVKPTLETAMPGDLSFVLPYRYLADLKETIFQLDKVMPGMADPNTLLYGVEVKFYSVRIKVSKTMESLNIKNLYCVGDGAGITRGIIQASAAGIVAADDIIKDV